MLKDFAKAAQNKVADEALAFLAVQAAAEKSVELPLLQKQLVARIQESGGQVTKAELEGSTDKGTVNALLEKNLIKVKLSGDDVVFTLVDDTVSAMDKVQVSINGMSAEELRENIAEYIGKGGQAKLARIIGVNAGTVRKWAQGVLGVPQHVVVFFAMLEHMKAQGIPLPDFVEPAAAVEKLAA